MRDLEDWPDRTLELYVLVHALGLPLQPYRINFTRHFDYFQNCSGFNCWPQTFVANRSMNFVWNPTTNGQIIGFQWFEEGDGSTQTTSFTYKPCTNCVSITNSFTKTDNTISLGDAFVNYNSNLGSQNYLDLFWFSLSR